MEAPEPEYSLQAMNVTQDFAASCVNEVSELKLFALENFREWTERGKKSTSRYPLQKE